MSAIATAGCRAIVFAGGDPSLRKDIESLLNCAAEGGLCTEVQTNGHYTPDRFLSALTLADLVGVSIDGASADVHDALRGRSHNFERCLRLLEWLEREQKPVVVRSVVLPDNYKEFGAIATILSRFSNVTRWSILEFSPIGDGFLNRSSLSVSSEQFEQAAAAAAYAWRGSGDLDVYRRGDKVGTYLLITPAGLVYGTTAEQPPGGIFPTVGSIITDHLRLVAERLPFAAGRHQARYAGLLRRVRR